LCLFGEIDRVDLYQKENGENYVRVVDYKTGGHDFSLTNVANGLDLQMLLYLFALWNEGFLWEGQKIEPKPAGVIYLNGLEEAVSCDTAEELEAVLADPFYSLSRKGLIVNDAELLAAQDPEGKGAFLPVAWGKNRPSGAANLVSMAQIGKLKEKVERDFRRLAEELKEGRIEANPLYSKGKGIDPCRYCEYLPLCKRSECDRRAYRSKVAREELFGKEEG
jgi:ATP-dependent helicase/nuclease subunit B